MHTRLQQRHESAIDARLFQQLATMAFPFALLSPFTSNTTSPGYPTSSTLGINNASRMAGGTPSQLSRPRSSPTTSLPCLRRVLPTSASQLHRVSIPPSRPLPSVIAISSRKRSLCLSRSTPFCSRNPAPRMTTRHSSRLTLSAASPQSPPLSATLAPSPSPSPPPTSPRPSSRPRRRSSRGPSCLTTTISTTPIPVTTQRRLRI